MSKAQKSMPGKSGLLAIDDTPVYMKNPFRYIQKHIAEHGRVFRSRLMLRDVVIMSGPEAGRLFNDQALVKRAGAFPGFILKLFGGESLPFLDGKKHHDRKEAVLQAFTLDALTSYLPDMQRIVESSLEEWTSLGEFEMAGRLKDLAFEVICANMLGIKRGEQLKELQAHYDAVTAGLVSLPIQLPGLPYDHAVRAKDHIFDKLRFLVELRKNTPTNDGVSRMFSAEAQNRTELSVDEAALEIHHAIIAGYIIYGELIGLMRDISRERAVRKLLTEELENGPQGRLKIEHLAKLRYLGQFVMEVKRLCPIIAVQFGEARVDFELHGFTVPEGWMILWALQMSDMDPDVYTDPERFDPERFSPERAENLRQSFAYVPQGGGPPTGHRCPGFDYATQLMEVFAIALIRGYRWQVKNPAGPYNWSLNPPQPVDNLLATIAHK